MEGKKLRSERSHDIGAPLDWDGWENSIHGEEGAKMFFGNFLHSLRETKLTLANNAKILDVGSGNGRVLRYLRDEGRDAYGVDVRPRGEARQATAAARIEQLPFADETFDAVLANAVFDDADAYPLQEQDVMIKEIARVLKKGGTFFAQMHLPKFNKRTMSRYGLRLIREIPGTTHYQKITRTNRKS